MGTRCLSLAIIFLLAATPRTALAVWSSSGLPVCEATGDQTVPVAARDGRFGTFVVWLDVRSDPDGDIYACYINSDGSLRSSWTVDGNPICALSNAQAQPTIISVGEGHAIIAWIDDRNGNFDVFAQHIDRDGNALWTPNGMAICTAARTQQQIAMAADGFGGAFMVWADNRDGATNGNTWDIYAIHVDDAGASPDLGAGAVICKVGNDQVEPSVVAGANGPMFFWEDEDLKQTPFVGAQVNGLEEVDDDTRELVDQTPSIHHASVSDGAGGALVSWTDNTVNPQLLRCIRFAPNGTVVTGWANGAVAGEITTVQTATVAPDNSGGALLSWEEDGDINVQHLEADGGVASGWDANGEVLCGEGSPQNNQAMTFDASNGAIVCWQDLRVTSNRNALFAGRIRGDAVQPWSPSDGTRLVDTTPVRDEHEASIVPDIGGGAVVVWSHQIASNQYDIYAQRIDADGAPASLVSVEPGVGHVAEISVRPNPIVERNVDISFSLPVGGRVSVGIYDLAGRLVSQIVGDGLFGPGASQVRWDVRDSQGQRCHAGVYWVRVAALTAVATKRFAVLK